MPVCDDGMISKNVEGDLEQDVIRKGKTSAMGKITAINFLILVMKFS